MESVNNVCRALLRRKPKGRQRLMSPQPDGRGPRAEQDATKTMHHEAGLPQLCWLHLLRRWMSRDRWHTEVLFRFQTRPVETRSVALHVSVFCNFAQFLLKNREEFASRCVDVPGTNYIYIPSTIDPKTENRQERRSVVAG